MTYLQVTSDYNKLYITEIDEKNEIHYRTSDYQPETFVTAMEADEHRFRTLIEDKPLRKIKFDDIKSFRQYQKDKRDIDGLDLYNTIQPEYQYIRETYGTKGTFVSPRKWMFDIETDLYDGKFSHPETALAPITVMQVMESDTKHIYVFSTLSDYSATREDLTFTFCESEEEMFNRFLTLIGQRKPFLWAAWNGDNFDYPYIINRCKRIGIDPKLFSPFNKLEEHKTVIFGKESKILKPVGMVWIDMIDAYKKLNPGGRESWALDYICNYHKVTTKLDYKSAGFKTFKDFMNGHYQASYDVEKDSELYNLSQMEPSEVVKAKMLKLARDVFHEYAIRDVEALYALDTRLNIFDVLFSVMQTMRCNLYDVMGTTKPWTVHIYNELYSRGIALPGRSSYSKREFPGGYVYAKPGKYDWVMSVDATSLYPSAIRQGGYSPETYIPMEAAPEDLKQMILSTGIYRAHDCEDIYDSLPKSTKEQIAELLRRYNLTMGTNGT